jgi:hypothetical protein
MSTGIDTEAPASSSSGIGTGGPVYANVVGVSAGCPVGIENVAVVGESAPANDTRTFSAIGLPSG